MLLRKAKISLNVERYRQIVPENLVTGVENPGLQLEEPMLKETHPDEATYAESKKKCPW